MCYPCVRLYTGQHNFLHNLQHIHNYPCLNWMKYFCIISNNSCCNHELQKLVYLEPNGLLSQFQQQLFCVMQKYRTWYGQWFILIPGDSIVDIKMFNICTWTNVRHAITYLVPVPTVVWQNVCHVWLKQDKDTGTLFLGSHKELECDIEHIR